ncbi:lipase maturation factor family protein [Euzebya sp.]|uniref:lipase maturation factor family protein n=1 Tax=Euzebya sp. TaxID=1971409 RepID=UPI0035191CD4
MDWLAAEGYEGARWLLTRLVGALYALAFANAALGWRGLLGDDGLLPARRVVERLDPRHQLTVFAWRYSDDLVVRTCWAAAAVSLAMALGLPQRGPSWVPLALWLVLWALYLSIVTIGQIWYAFGWETILLEAGFVAAFLGSDADVPSWAAILAVRWLLFRIEFGAGLIKLRGDACWRDLTCLDFHHETQPIPGPLSWWAHTRPGWWHRVEVAGNHVTQLVMPVGLFLPQPVAGIAAVSVIATQGWLILTGNFAWLNAVTVVLALSAVPDAWLGWLPVDTAGDGGLPAWLGAVTLAVAAMVLVMSWRPVRNMMSPDQLMNAAFNRFRLVGTYGAFGSVTRTRYEIVLEGTDAEDPDAPDTEWRTYAFKGKPGDPARRPPQVAPWHLRLDWLMWFAAMTPHAGRHDVWFRRLVEGLLEGRPAIRRLLALDPFSPSQPRWIRARRCRYRFTTPDERRATGDFWVVEPVGEFLPPIRRPPTRRHTA